jgi:hypothetical protein
MHFKGFDEATTLMYRVRACDTGDIPRISEVSSDSTIAHRESRTFSLAVANCDWSSIARSSELTFVLVHSRRDGEVSFLNEVINALTMGVIFDGIVSARVAPARDE